MSTHIIDGVKIHTSHDYLPIPTRDMDWSAVTDAAGVIGMSGINTETIARLADEYERKIVAVPLRNLC